MPSFALTYLAMSRLKATAKLKSCDTSHNNHDSRVNKACPTNHIVHRPKFEAVSQKLEQSKSFDSGATPAVVAEVVIEEVISSSEIVSSVTSKSSNEGWA